MVSSDYRGGGPQKPNSEIIQMDQRRLDETVQLTLNQLNILPEGTIVTFGQSARYRFSFTPEDISHVVDSLKDKGCSAQVKVVLSSNPLTNPKAPETQEYIFNVTKSLEDY